MNLQTKHFLLIALAIELILGLSGLLNFPDMNIAIMIAMLSFINHIIILSSHLLSDAYDCLLLYTKVKKLNLLATK